MRVTLRLSRFPTLQAPVTLHLSTFAGGKTCVTAEGDAEVWRGLPENVQAVASSVPESVWVATKQLGVVLLHVV